MDASSVWYLKIEGLQGGMILGALHCGNGQPAPPSIELCVDGDVIGEAEVTPQTIGYVVTAKLPSSVLNEGVTTIVFRMASNGAVLASYRMRAGAALDVDVVAELAALRAELDALKAAFLSESHDVKLRAVERDLIVAEAVEIATKTLSEKSTKSGV